MVGYSNSNLLANYLFQESYNIPSQTRDLKVFLNYMDGRIPDDIYFEKKLRPLIISKSEEYIRYDNSLDQFYRAFSCSKSNPNIRKFLSYFIPDYDYQTVKEKFSSIGVNTKVPVNFFPKLVGDEEDERLKTISLEYNRALKRQ